jgi:hypothetical protein
MSLIFKPEHHEYVSLNEENIDWVSVTSFIGNFKPKFDAKAQSVKSSKNKKSKWYGMTPEEFQQAWINEAKRATDLGTWYHNQRESDICELETIQRQGITVPIFKPVEVDGIKYAPEQKLVEGVYPEHMVYLKSAGLCGQSDYVEVVGGHVNIMDYKTNKEIKSEGFTNWEGITAKMSAPVNQLDDCNLNHYTLQLSLYMFIILKHNPHLKPGKMVLHHIKFHEAGKDKFGNPIAALSAAGDPIVEEIINYEVPYLKKEATDLINYLKENRDKFKKKI